MALYILLWGGGIQLVSFEALQRITKDTGDHRRKAGRLFALGHIRPEWMTWCSIARQIPYLYIGIQI